MLGYNKEDSENIEFIEKLKENNGIDLIKRSEIKDTKLIKVTGYGIILKGLWGFKRVIAMKHIPNELMNENKEVLEKIMQNLSIIKHQNILRFLGISMDLETKGYFAVLEYAENGNLHDYLLKPKDLSWNQKINISKDIACGLNFMHKMGIIHKRLDTKTIFIKNGKTPTAQISNPAFLEMSIGASSSMILQGGMIAFLDPRLLIDVNLKFTATSDIYSLGIVMWSISSGKLPFENATNQSILANKIICGNIRETPVNGTPKPYFDLYKSCWEFDSKRRPSAQEVFDQLEIMLRESYGVPLGK